MQNFYKVHEDFSKETSWDAAWTNQWMEAFIRWYPSLDFLLVAIAVILVLVHTGSTGSTAAIDDAGCAEDAAHMLALATR